jgi:hypothetical protein
MYLQLVSGQISQHKFLSIAHWRETGLSLGVIDGQEHHQQQALIPACAQAKTRPILT